MSKEEIKKFNFQEKVKLLHPRLQLSIFHMIEAFLEIQAMQEVATHE